MAEQCRIHHLLDENALMVLAFVEPNEMYHGRFTRPWCKISNGSGMQGSPASE